MKKEIIEAAGQGILKLIAESKKGSDAYGARVIDTPRGFCVVHSNGDRVYFDILEI